MLFVVDYVHYVLSFKYHSVCFCLKQSGFCQNLHLSKSNATEPHRFPGQGMNTVNSFLTFKNGVFFCYCKYMYILYILGWKETHGFLSDGAFSYSGKTDNPKRKVGLG